MSNQQHLDVLAQGVTVWNQWRQEYPDVYPNLSQADLHQAQLSEVDLSGANLSGTDLSQAELMRANLREAKLMCANLRQADLSEANLSQADLNTSCLEETNLSWANLGAATLIDALAGRALLNGANLSEADLRNAHLHGALLPRANLAQANLRDAYLASAQLSAANLSKANCTNANFQRAHLNEASLIDADFSGAKLEGSLLIAANLGFTKLCGANLTGANLVGVNLLETDFTAADLTGCLVYGVSVWDAKLDGAIQHNLVITPPDQPTITIDDLEVAQFVYLLLNHKKLRNVLNAVTSRGVLLLGGFGNGGLERLQALASRLRVMHYIPIIFDFERPAGRNYTETVKTLVGLSRFIIADLSGPSVPQELYATVPHFKIPFVPIIKAGKQPYAMAVDMLEYSWVIRPPVTFTSTQDLLGQLQARIVTPAEEKHQAREQLLNELFPRE